MKKTLLFAMTFSTGLALLSGCKDAPKSDEAQVKDSVAVSAPAPQAQQYAVDAANSQMTWIGTKPTGRHNGTVNIKSGTLSVDSGKVVGGTLVIDAASLKATDAKDQKDNDKLTGHLTNADFLDVTKYPEARFEITSVAPYTPTGKEEKTELQVADPNYLVTGNLTLKNATKSVTFPAKITVENGAVTALANFNIDRTNWGISYNAEGSVADKVIHNKVNIGLNIKAMPQQ